MRLIISDAAEYSNRQMVMGTSEAYPGKLLISIEEKGQIMQGYRSGAQITMDTAELKNWLEALYKILEEDNGSR